MQTPFGHITYCSNIHTGEKWEDHFEQLKINFPAIKKSVCPQNLMGIGLRLSAAAANKLIKKKCLKVFKQWLADEGGYVFTMNGFPYGGFHHTVVKDKVHAPDWTTQKRVAYTQQLALILAQLLPPNMEGSISTSPLSYKYWYKTETAKQSAVIIATHNIIAVVIYLIQIEKVHHKTIHLDIEPEPDGLLTDTKAFVNWYEDVLIKVGTLTLISILQVLKQKATGLIRKHVQLCYDVCHAAVNYEDHKLQINHLRKKKIPVGKIQISAALKAVFPKDKIKQDTIFNAFKKFSEPVYLHQVVEKNKDGGLFGYPDLPQAIKKFNGGKEWRVHFHVPIFTKQILPLTTTQKDIIDILKLHKANPISQHLEVETYTWEVLPADLKKDIRDSISRELNWVLKQLKK